MDTKTTVETFECSLLKGTATIISTFSVHDSGKTGQHRFDCGNAKDCGVMDGRGNFAWAKCVHPKLNRKV